MSRELSPEEVENIDRRTSKTLISIGGVATAFFGVLAVRRGIESEWGHMAWLSALSATSLFCTVREQHELRANHPEPINPVDK